MNYFDKGRYCSYLIFILIIFIQFWIFFGLNHMPHTTETSNTNIDKKYYVLTKRMSNLHRQIAQLKSNNVDEQINVLKRVFYKDLQDNFEVWNKSKNSEVKWWANKLSEYAKNELGEDGTKYYNSLIEKHSVFGHVIGGKGSKSPEVFHKLVNLSLVGNDNVIRAIDVGCSWTPKLGKRWPDLHYKLKVYGCDPLAEEYNKILAENNIFIEPENVVDYCEGERLTDVYPSNFFDLVFIRNALDHSFFPLRVILEMLSIVKHGQMVYTRHYVNEGRTDKYVGMHQWNIYISNEGDPMLMNKYGVTYNLKFILSEVCESIETNFLEPIDLNKNRVEIIFKKK